MRTLVPTLAPGRGFWASAFGFAVLMAFSTLPTPLYVLYERLDGFGPAVVTVVFAVYAVGVAASLLLFGPLSDRVGRRRVLVPALALGLLSALPFLLWPALPGLLLGRFLSGLAVGVITSAATAHLSELDAAANGWRSSQRASVVAIAANLGGLSLGTLTSGLLAQYAPAPLILPYAVFMCLLLAAVLAMLATPETVRAGVNFGRYHLQRVLVPEGAARPRFLVALTDAVLAFAVFGVFTALAPTFLAGVLHESSHALAGAASFAVFAAAAAGQIGFARVPPRVTQRTGVLVWPIGLGLVVAGVLLTSLPLFLLGGISAGVGVGLSFRGALATVTGLARDDQRGEMLAALFLSAYTGLAVPVLGLGLVAVFVPMSAAFAGFAGVLVVAQAVAAGVLVRSERGRSEGVRAAA